VRSRGATRTGSRRDAPDLDHEREVVRAFTDLYRQRRFTRAPRPVVPLRPRDPRLKNLVDATSVELKRAPEPVEGPARRRAERASAVSEAGAEPARRQPRLPSRPVPPARRPASRRRGWAGVAERHLSDVLALAGASVALVAPWVWLMVVAGFCLTAGAIRSVMADERPVGAGIVALPERATRRVGRLLRPRSLAWLPVITARTILAAILLPGLVAGTVWLADHGSHGVFAALRLAAWQSGFRVVAAVLCLMMLAGVGDGRARRADLVRRGVARWSDASVVALAAGALSVAAIVVVAGPRLSGGPLTGADGLGWAPAQLRPAVDDLRDPIVAAELRALASCLTERQGVVWSIRYSADNPLDAPDVARLSLGQTAEPEPAALVTAMVAADNQLASWVERVELAIGDTVALAVDREALSHDSVRVDAPTLDPGIVIGSDLAAKGVTGYDRTVALACSAGPVI
jgi:hypothetical protein